MLADKTRTSSYHKAIAQNESLFKDKTVLDVGTGTGIFSFFAVQGKAKKVYAVEASRSIEIAKQLAHTNQLADRIEFIHQRLEDVELPETVDIIISEPMGIILVHERMLESYIIARNRFLRSDGLGQMIPYSGTINFCPIQDFENYEELCWKASQWRETNFFDINLSPMTWKAYAEIFAQAVIVSSLSSQVIMMSKQYPSHTIDFLTISLPELQAFTIPIDCLIETSGIIHGFVGWFDVQLTETIQLSTTPFQSPTHWQQTCLYFLYPLHVSKGDQMIGFIHFEISEQYSYYVTIQAEIVGQPQTKTVNKIHLYDQVKEKLLFHLLSIRIMIIIYI
jgi:type I protein arginine methyltransferase